MKYLTQAQVAANRAKLANRALGKPAHLTSRDLEVINNAEHYRVHVFDRRLPGGRFVTTFGTPALVARFYQQLLPEVRDRLLVYAVMGQRDALIPKSRYPEFILLPAPGQGQPTRA